MILVLVGQGRSSRSVTVGRSGRFSGGSGGRIVCLPWVSASLYGFAVDIPREDTRSALSVTVVGGGCDHTGTLLSFWAFGLVMGQLPRG